MRLVTYSTNGSPLRLGILLGDDTILDPQLAYCEKLIAAGQGRAEELAQALLPSDPTAFLANGDFAVKAAGEAIEYAAGTPQTSALYNKADVTLGSPVPKPNKIICVGLNYRDHIQEMGREIPSVPLIFAKFGPAVIGPFDDVPRNAHLTQKLDYEAEFAFVIGKKGKDIPRADAFDYVAGYCAVNDITARDMQKRTLQWLQGKTLDASLPMGPCLVTKDEIEDPHNLNITLTVNGEIRQTSNTKQLVFDVPQLVEFLSHIVTLEPGDVVCTGTPGGVGEARGIFLQTGDVVRVELENVGVIENRIAE
ncbi:fumarylacetoacetate hydrolase family protein [Paenibacillus thalictri]|uniref:FAA hydrolase family protein n=1 Tax=Paenibacillus thalictri TaxID=2527873 RepID=A0A4Q9DLI5_9BACL|nr:fumarylacetoacetate hydrolase family protein [Paenibacillus thalictri]TBL73335.1 FAA hydrolase family protein [Paenibacillus thalictri]